MTPLLPPRGRLRDICLMLADRPEPIYLVGGYVRDWLLGRASHDLDFAVVGDAVDLARAVANRFGGYFVLLDQEHNTARAVFRDQGESYNVDLAGIRGHDILADLRARDLTMNAIAVCLADLGAPQPALLDPTLGGQDIERRLVRATSDLAFQDDPIRTLRAVRQAGSLGFEIAPTTEALIARDAHLLGDVAGERVCAELAQLFTQPGLAANLGYLGLLGLIAPIFPEVWALRGRTVEGESGYDLALRTVAGVEHLLRGTWRAGMVGLDAVAAHETLLTEHFAQVLADIRDRACLLKLMALLISVGDGPSPAVDEGRHAAMEAMLRRLRLSVREINLAHATLHGQRLLADLLGAGLEAERPSLSSRQRYRFSRDLGDAVVDVICLALARAWAARWPARRQARWASLVVLSEQLLGYIASQWPGIVALPPLLGGRQLMQALGLRGGPVIGQLLEGIREAQAVGELASPEEALAWAESWLAQRPDQGDEDLSSKGM